MLRILECAASGVLLVIPETSHLWSNVVEARKLGAVVELQRPSNQMAQAPRAVNAHKRLPPAS